MRDPILDLIRVDLDDRNARIVLISFVYSIAEVSEIRLNPKEETSSLVTTQEGGCVHKIVAILTCYERYSNAS